MLNLTDIKRINNCYYFGFMSSSITYKFVFCNYSRIKLTFFANIIIISSTQLHIFLKNLKIRAVLGLRRPEPGNVAISHERIEKVLFHHSDVRR